MSNENEVKDVKKKTMVGVTNSQIDGKGNIEKETLATLSKEQTAITRQKKEAAKEAKKTQGLAPNDKEHRSKGPESGADKAYIKELEDKLENIGKAHVKQIEDFTNETKNLLADAKKERTDDLKKQSDDFQKEINALKNSHKDELAAIKKA